MKQLPTFPFYPAEATLPAAPRRGVHGSGAIQRSVMGLLPILAAEAS